MEWKLRWIGHTLRRNQTNIARHVLDWKPQGKRREDVQPRHDTEPWTLNSRPSSSPGARWNRQPKTKVMEWRPYVPIRN